MGAFDWTNKVVLVTGGTRGIGLETALCFARAGARPVITYRWGGSEEVALARFSAEALPQPLLVRADVSRESDTQRLMTELKADCDGIDAFLSNVSVASMVKSMEDYKLRALQRSIECTSWPMVAYTQAIHATFGRWPRYIVALSSFGTEQLAMNYDFVAASKAVVETLIPYLAWRLGPEGVRVNGLTCGLAKTESSVGMAGSEYEAFEAWHHRCIGPIPYVRVEDVANALFALCSGWLDGMNGQILRLDDGSMNFAENRYGLFRAFQKHHEGVGQ